jgi:hypothetical protein
MSRRTWRTIAIVLTFLCFGAVQEWWRIRTSMAPDIVANRDSLTPIADALTVLMLVLGVVAWVKMRRAPAA